MCHGTYGEGNGPTSVALTVKPPNWSNPMWQLSVTNQGIRSAIVGGGEFIGRSSNMPSHNDLEGDPVLDGLVELIREFGRR
jgi:hypothetical protein